MLTGRFRRALLTEMRFPPCQLRCAHNGPLPKCVIIDFLDVLVAKHFVQVRVIRRRHEATPFGAPPEARLPLLQAVDQMRPQRLRRLGYPQHQTTRMLNHLAAHLQHRQYKPL